MKVTVECYYVSSAQSGSDEYYIQFSDRTDTFWVRLKNKGLWEACSELPVGMPILLTLEWIPASCHNVESIEILDNYSDGLNVCRKDDGIENKSKKENKRQHLQGRLF